MTGTRKRRVRDEAGITLVEILICVVVVGVLTATLGALFGTTLRGTASVTQKVNESNDAQLIATFLNRDAQAVGGINPNTGITDPTLGISTSDADSCTGTGTLVVRFKWKDLAPTPVTYRASYFYDSATKSLTRVLCSGTNTTFELGRKVASATTACTPACTGIPVDVALTVTETNVPANAPTPYQYTLKAAVRPEAKSSVPTSLNAGVVPLIALGDGIICPALSITGNNNVEVIGTVIVNATDEGTCEAMKVSGNARLFSPAGGGDGDDDDDDHADPNVRILEDGTCDGNRCPDFTNYSPAIADPLGGTMPVPSGSCSGLNPGMTGNHYRPDVYPSPLTVTGTVVFEPGVYLLCNGISFSSSAIVSGSGVFFYVPSGTVSFRSQAKVNLSAPSSGSYKGVLIWKANSTTMTFGDNSTVDTGGFVYAPTSSVVLNGDADVVVGALIAKTISISGNAKATFGPVPLSITGPSSLADATYDVTYTSAAFTTKGGSGGVAWSTSSPMPPGLSLNVATGVIEGKPTWTPTKTYPITVTATDSSGATATRGVNLRVVAPPKPMSIELKNSGKPGSTAGKVEQGDQIIVTYSERMAVDTFCPGGGGWSGDNADQAIDGSNDVIVTLANGSGNNSDTISFTASGCSGGFNFSTNNNTLTLGNKDFTTSTRTFGGSQVADRSTVKWDAANYVLTITLGKASSTSGIATQNTPTNVTYTPDSVLDSSLGVGIIGTATTGNVKQF